MPNLSKSHRVVAVDLLGFGLSPKPKDVRYDAATHIASIMETLEKAGIGEPFILAGHSMGALLSLKLALRYPEKVRRLVLISMPIYASPEECMEQITKGARSRKIAYYGWTSKLLCSTWCGLLRPLSKHAARLYLKHQPPHVAEDSVYHSWQAYSESLEYVIAHQSVNEDLQKLKMPVELLYGDKESPMTHKYLKKLELPKNVHTLIAPGTHNLPLETPQRVSKSIISG